LEGWGTAYALEIRIYGYCLLEGSLTVPKVPNTVGGGTELVLGDCLTVAVEMLGGVGHFRGIVALCGLTFLKLTLLSIDFA
jgi:hypothetical protein